MNKIKLRVMNFYYGFKCNLACRGCNSGSDIIFHKDYDPSIENILETISNFSNYVEDVTDMITIVGGEPTLYWHDKVVPMARHIRSLFPNVVININTNALLIHKLRDDIVNLFLEVDNIRLSIDNHLVSFSDSKEAQKFSENLQYFLSHPLIHKIHDMHYDIPDRKIDFMLHEFYEFKAQFKFINGKIKPFSTNDPVKSMENGCVGNVCAAAIDNKLYKCPRLLALPKILAEKEQLDDPDWQKYLNYKSIDLKTATQEEIDNFKHTEGKAIPECDGCPDGKEQNIHWYPQSKENVLKFNPRKSIK